MDQDTKKPPKDDRNLRGAVICLSGGMDCTALLWYIKEYVGIEKVCAMNFRYGQAHQDREYIASANVWDHFRDQYPDTAVEYTSYDLSILKSLAPNAALLTGDIPNVEHPTKRRRTVVVPGRNMVFLSLAVAKAAALKYGHVFFGACGDDSADFPDCRPPFAIGMNAAAFEGYRVHVSGPFATWPKSKIIKWGIDHKVPFDKTYTCYKGGEVPCGSCQACVERLDAFTINGVEDPLMPTV